ncbi:MAG: ParA family protein, partial [Chthoniobacteraceae bacterium]|nr:ParA family protein [Chthoniobacteraceae bacterium]
MHVLSVSSLKGGVGKTTISLGLASAAYARGLRTLVVDLDTQCDASTGLGAIGDYETTVLDVIKNPQHSVVHKSILASTWNRTQPSKIDVMVGEPLAAAFDTPNPSLRDIWTLEEALSRIQNEYDLVIIDTPPSLNGLTRAAWAASDRVVIVSEPGIFAVSSVKRAISAVDEVHDRLNHRLSLAGVVLNRLNSNFVEHEFRQTELQDIAGDALLPFSFPERAAIQQAQGAARPIHSWPGEAAAEISSLFDDLLSHIQESLQSAPAKRTRGRNQKAKQTEKVKQGWFRRSKKTEDPTQDAE